MALEIAFVLCVLLMGTIQVKTTMGATYCLRFPQNLGLAKLKDFDKVEKHSNNHQKIEYVIERENRGICKALTNPGVSPQTAAHTRTFE